MRYFTRVTVSHRVTYKKRLNRTEGTAMRPMKILNRLRYLLWSAEIMYQGLPVPLTFLLVEPS